MGIKFMNHNDKMIIAQIKNTIMQLSIAEQEQCNELADHMRRMIAAAGIPVGTLALALVGAEQQAKY